MANGPCCKVCEPKVKDCSLVRCAAPECKDGLVPIKPEGECCEVCMFPLPWRGPAPLALARAPGMARPRARGGGGGWATHVPCVRLTCARGHTHRGGEREGRKGGGGGGGGG